MIRYLQLTCFVIFSLFLHAQDKPLIGSQTGVKEKLVLIKKGLPDIKKNLTRRIDNYSEDREVKIVLGNDDGIYSETDKEQTIHYSFSKFYFSGSIEEYKNFYLTLLKTIKEVFDDKYDSLEYEKKEKEWCVSFYEKGKKYDSPTGIYICCDWRLPSSGPKINLFVFRKM